MDSKTADSLFAGDDDSADFFGSSSPAVEEEHANNANSFQASSAPQPISYQSQQTQQSSEIAHDPYSQLHSNETSQPTAVDQASTIRDPYSPQSIRNGNISYTPNIVSSASSTYSPPSSQANSYDPYAQVTRGMHLSTIQ